MPRRHIRPAPRLSDLIGVPTCRSDACLRDLPHPPHRVAAVYDSRFSPPPVPHDDPAGQPVMVCLVDASTTPLGITLESEVDGILLSEDWARPSRWERLRRRPLRTEARRLLHATSAPVVVCQADGSAWLANGTLAG